MAKFSALTQASIEMAKAGLPVISTDRNGGEFGFEFSRRLTAAEMQKAQEIAQKYSPQADYEWEVKK